MEKGAIGFLAKPVTQKDIEVAIQKIENIFNSGVKDILVIEDNKVSQQSIVRLLENREVRITTSDTGEEALNLLNQHHFDCIVLDLALPDMTGFDLLKELDKTGIKKIPVIVYTGKELAKEEITELNKYTRSIIIKGAISPERLLDEVSLFLHSLNTNLSEEQQRIVSRLHANQSRIHQFPLRDKENCIYSSDVISFARKKGYFNGKDKDFDFANAYNPLTFEGRRFCEARVWSFFQKYCKATEKYIDYIKGSSDEPMPRVLNSITNWM